MAALVTDKEEEQLSKVAENIGFHLQRRHSSGGEESVAAATTTNSMTTIDHRPCRRTNSATTSPRSWTAAAALPVISINNNSSNSNVACRRPMTPTDCEDVPHGDWPPRQQQQQRRQQQQHQQRLLAVPTLPANPTVTTTVLPQRQQELSISSSPRRRLSSPLQPPARLLQAQPTDDEIRMPRSLPPSPHRPSVVQSALDLRRGFDRILLSKTSDLPEHRMVVVVPKTRPSLGIAIEGGIDTQHQLARIINIHPRGAASEASGLKVGLVLLAVDGMDLKGLPHRDMASRITEAFADPSRPHMELVVGQMKKPTLEMRRSSIMPIRDARR